MSQAMGPIAAASSMASLGFQAEATKEQYAGQASGYQFESQNELLRSRYEEVAANQTRAAGYAGVAKTMGNFDATSAAMNIDPLSPTNAALRQGIERTEIQKVQTAYASQKIQSDMDAQAALYHSQLAAYTQSMGDYAVMGKIFGGLAQTALSLK